jgi:hypothetical protein
MSITARKSAASGDESKSIAVVQTDGSCRARLDNRGEEPTTATAAAGWPAGDERESLTNQAGSWPQRESRVDLDYRVHGVPEVLILADGCMHWSHLRDGYGGKTVQGDLCPRDGISGFCESPTIRRESGRTGQRCMKAGCPSGTGRLRNARATRIGHEPASREGMTTLTTDDAHAAIAHRY